MRLILTSVRSRSLLLRMVSRWAASGWAACPGAVLLLTMLASASADEVFQREILPLLTSHCVSCHGPEKQQSGIRLDTLSTDLINDRAAAEDWQEVLNVLNSGEMPPEDQLPLTAEQHRVLTAWVGDRIRQAVEAGRETTGRVVLRRLTRLEYQNTMSELLGLDMDYTRDLPPDSVSEDGFVNDGRALRMSAMQLEYYLDSARRALERVIVTGPAPEVFHHEFTESRIDNWLGNAQRSMRLGRQQEFLSRMTDRYPETGEFLVRVRLAAELKSGAGFPLLEVSVGYQPDTEILMRDFELVEITTAEEQTLEFRGRIENFPLPVRGQGKFPGLVVRVRNVYTDGSPLPPEATPQQRDYPDEPHLPTVTLKSVEFHGPVFDQWPPALHRRILLESEQREQDETGYVTEVLRRFMTRAFRRPVSDDEVARLVEFHNSIRPDFPTLEETLRESLAMVLIQPDFLYHLEPAGVTKRPVGHFELASRLSYFLWSTMPDPPLLDLAGRGVLTDPAVLSAEVERMSDDPRFQVFVRQFTEQWLHLNYLDRVAVDREYYPGFDDALKVQMRGETEAFFAELIRSDLSALNLLSSAFVMLNEPLARHYGIPGVTGRSFRRVELPAEAHRGGLLSQASILLSNSTGADSHVVRRAVWIRDRLLNDPPSPPPPDTPPLDPANPDFARLSVREQLEIHRQREACASCHRGIDPWGIALENYDAVGHWRSEIRRKVGGAFTTIPVKAADTLPGDHQIDGAESLKAWLVTNRSVEFARSLVVRLATYAVGRRLELTDQAEIDRLTQEFVADGYRIRGLLRRLVTSELFLTK